MVILNVTKKQSFSLSVEDTFLEKPQEEGIIDLSSLFRVEAVFLCY